MSETKKSKRKWSSRSLGSHLQHQFFYVMIRLGGRRLAYVFLFFVVSWYTLFRPAIRGRTYHYLRRRFPEARGLGLLRHSYRLSMEFGKILVDRAVVGILGPESMNVSFQNREAMLEIMQEKKGFILMISHVGCWQVAMSGLDFLQTPVNMHMQRAEGDVDRHYFEHAGKTQPFKVIDPTGYLGGTLEMIGALKNGEALCVMGDRVQGSDRNVVSVDFLGEAAVFPFSAFKIASATGAPVVVLFSHKTGPNSYDLELTDVLRVPSGLGRGSEPFKPYVREYVAALERFAREHPYQFYNFHDMWEENTSNT